MHNPAARLHQISTIRSLNLDLRAVKHPKEESNVESALVLIVEDEPEIASILDAYFTRDGFRTVTAGNGEIALQHHLMLAPDLIVLDVKLPRTDGFAVLAEIRRRGGTPVIMATALSTSRARMASNRAEWSRL